MSCRSTIAAVATAPGVGAVSIVRLSGPKALAVLDRVFKPAGPSWPWRSHYLRFGQVLEPDSGRLLDQALAVFFQGPHSFTGEDCAEIHGHGGPAVTGLILGALLKAGASMAQPGEFTRRAYENGQLDLSQAEAVAELIAAQTEAETALAARQLAGGLSRQLEPIERALRLALAELTAALDFSDDLPEPDFASLQKRLRLEVVEPLERIFQAGRQGRFFRQGLRLALAGAPNVGKSTVFNRLLGQDRSLVSPHAGTTRDYVTACAQLGPLRLELGDTAGLSARPQDELDELGQRRSREHLAQADLIVWVRDISSPADPAEEALGRELAPDRTLVVWNKADLPPVRRPEPGEPVFSALSGQGLPELKEALVARVCGHPKPEPPDIVPNLRHQAALAESLNCLGALFEAIDEGRSADECAFELSAAAKALEPICGRWAPEDILTDIFSRFCLGK